MAGRKDRSKRLKTRPVFGRKLYREMHRLALDSLVEHIAARMEPRQPRPIRRGQLEAMNNRAVLQPFGDRLAKLLDPLPTQRRQRHDVITPPVGSASVSESAVCASEFLSEFSLDVL